MAVCCDTDIEDGDRTRIYIVGEDIYKEVYTEITKGSMFNWALLVSYVLSLVHIQKHTPKGKRERKTKRLVK